jgi:L-phenylalanine/L-methionine N-acetyltransferase
MASVPTAPFQLRRARPADAAALAAQMADPAVYGNLMQLPWPTEELWRQRLEAMAAAKESADLLLLAERGGQLLGSLGLHPVDRVRRRHAAMLGISVGAEHQGQGVGTALLQAACDYADRWAHLLRLELTVFVDNPRAIALYRRCGFREEGRHVAYALRDGRYVDVFSMARLHPDAPRATWTPGTAPA